MQGVPGDREGAVPGAMGHPQIGGASESVGSGQTGCSLAAGWGQLALATPQGSSWKVLLAL